MVAWGHYLPSHMLMTQFLKINYRFRNSGGVPMGFSRCYPRLPCGKRFAHISDFFRHSHVLPWSLHFATHVIRGLEQGCRVDKFYAFGIWLCIYGVALFELLFEFEFKFHCAVGLPWVSVLKQRRRFGFTLKK